MVGELSLFGDRDQDQFKFPRIPEEIYGNSSLTQNITERGEPTKRSSFFHEMNTNKWLFLNLRKQE